MFLDRQWDHKGSGYFPSSNATGTSVESKARFGDDNALSGLMLVHLRSKFSAGCISPQLAERACAIAHRLAQVLRWGGDWLDADPGLGGYRAAVG